MNPSGDLPSFIFVSASHYGILFSASIRKTTTVDFNKLYLFIPGSPGWVKSVASGCPECLSNGKDTWIVSQGRILGSLAIDFKLQEFPYDEQLLVFFLLVE
jgi:hypothetical protein